MGESQYVMSLAHGACAGRSFDGVIASEVIEHVDGVPAFCAALAGLARPGGGVVVSTISRTQRSYALAILGAEYLLGLVPRGTHQWERFITPGEVILHGCSGHAALCSVQSGPNLSASCEVCLGHIHPANCAAYMRLCMCLRVAGFSGGCGRRAAGDDARRGPGAGQAVRHVPGAAVGAVVSNRGHRRELHRLVQEARAGA